MDSERDELLVNTNLPESTVRPMLTGLPARLLPNTEQRQGAFYAKAVRAARGEVLAFLDDDDRWNPTRITAVREAFARDPTLAHFHNEFRRIDSQGAPTVQLPTAARLARPPLDRTVATPGPVEGRALRRLIGAGSYFNLSSTCVRAEAIRPALPYLDRILTNDDSFFFFAAVLAGGGFHLDPRPLTDYRVHATNVSRGWDAGSRGGAAGDWPARAVRSHAVLLEMARSSGRRDVVEALEHDLAIMCLLDDVATGPRTRRESGEHLLALFRRGGIGYPPVNAGFALLGTAQLVSPRLGRFVHARLRK